MQFFGFKENIAVSALDAHKGEIYTCPECGAFLKMRSGLKRTPHFYHLRAPQKCSQHEKSIEHLLSQLVLYDQIPQGEGALEHSFPSIGRIADLVWFPKKLIFEIQSSPISLKEVEERNQDYAQIGFEVIWILHEKRFNKKTLSAAESFLRERLSYFSSITKEKEGMIYDQAERIRGGVRSMKGSHLKVDLTRPFPYPSEPPLSLPHILQQRRSSPYFFEGDLFARSLEDEGLLRLLFYLEKEEQPSPKLQQITTFFYKLYRRCLISLLHSATSLFLLAAAV